MEIEKLAHLVNFEDWQSRLSGSIIPLSVADAAVLPLDPGLPSGSSASASASPQEPGLPSGSSASAAAAALPGEDSEYEEAIQEPEITGRWVKRAGQTRWRICGVHMHHKHANDRRNHRRESAADVISIALRDKADAVTGDWNQAGGYLEEVVAEAVQLYEDERGLERGTVIWLIPGEPCEIRTVFSIGPLTA